MILRKLFDDTRFADGGSMVLTGFYFPFGLILVVIRLFIMLHALLVSCILPKCQATSFILKSLFGVVGIQVMVQEDKRKSRPEHLKPKIVVANHVSYLDHILIDLVQPVIAPDEVGFSSFYRWIFAYQDFGIAQGNETLQENIKKFLQDNSIPALFHPEGTPTNGSGLLKFRTFPFSLGVPVLPVSIQSTRWPLTVPVSTLHSTRLWDFFWSLFFPYTIFKLRLLEPDAQEDKETSEEFGERIRKKIAISLGVPATNYTMADRNEYLKRLLKDKAQKKQDARATTQSQGNNGITSGPSRVDNSVSPQLNKMADQVKNVLPDAPLALIIKDLENTKDVDATITNILEGQMSGDAKKTTDTTKIDHNITTGICASQQKYKSSTFARVPPERHMALEDRKKLMIATARQRYKEKHGMI